jgi:ribosomal protein S27AE
VVPPPPPEAAPAPGAEVACHSLPMAKHPKPRPATHRCGYIPWHVLMRQLGIDVETCPRCGGKMKIIALVRDPQSIARYLRHLGLPTEEPSMAVPTGPRAYPPCPCPTRLRRARRLPVGHRSGRAASCRRYGEPPDAGQA